MHVNDWLGINCWQNGTLVCVVPRFYLLSGSNDHTYTKVIISNRNKNNKLDFDLLVCVILCTCICLKKKMVKVSILMTFSHVRLDFSKTWCINVTLKQCFCLYIAIVFSCCPCSCESIGPPRKALVSCDDT